ncbi:hypothetical protein [Bauldia sp.]|uniref:hypothetical protein n=1 Tax=Bauldia sp. TaxID=2575872 RepID=UPI003BAAEEEA
MSKRFALIAGLAAASFVTVPALADEIMPIEALEGTVWASQESHDRTAIDANGDISLKESKDIYVAFGDLIDGVYTIKINWWNVEAGLNVVEYAVLLPESDNVYVYIETTHPADSSFPGIQGGGAFRVLDEDTATLTQAGRLLDGSASAFVTKLTRVEAPPEVPLAQTYPKP